MPASQLLDPSYEEVELPSDPRFEIYTQMQMFVSKAAQVSPVIIRNMQRGVSDLLQTYLDTFRTCCQNRSRQRRNMCHNIAYWEELQTEVC